MNQRPDGKTRMRALYFSRPVLTMLLVVATALCRAQDSQLPPPPLPVDPTPLNELLSPREKGLLQQVRKPRDTVDTYLNISDAHLNAALEVVKSGQSQVAERELDIYNKAVAECAKFAFSRPDGKRALAKRIEQRLYKQIKTLESIVLLFPIERVQFAEEALRLAKQVRVQSLNETFAGGEILKDPSVEKKPDKPPTDKQLDRQMRFAPAYVLREPQISGDYLTDEEDEQVREAQKADDRVKVFMKIADRRLEALQPNPPPPADKKAQKKAEEEQRDWGVLPKLTRAQLLKHYSRAISEAMAKLEDAYERNPKSAVVPKALTMLRESTDRHLQVLRALEPELKDQAELRALREAIDQAETANKGARDGLNQK